MGYHYNLGMIRKIIRQGKGAHTITLPAKWININHLKPGDEVNLIEKNSDLIITARSGSKYEKPELKATFNCKGIHWLTGPLIAAYYKRGYDELRVEYESKKELEKINWIVTQLPGFEVIETRANMILIKRIASASIEEYRNSLRRSCFILKIMSQDFVQALKTNNESAFLSIIASDDNLNKFTNYARHILMKDSSVEPVKAPPMYNILWALEKMGDIYKRLCQIHTKNKIKISKDVIALDKEISAVLAEFLELLFKYNQENLNSFYRKKKDMFRKIESLIQKSKDVETLHLSQINVLASLIFDCTALVVNYHI